MTLLRADELLSSPVVANATMNRGRGLGGVNSYERDLRFSITDFLAERGGAVWYDACCGQGKPLVEAGQFAEKQWGRRVRIVGVDLVGMFAPEQVPNVTLIAADVAAFCLGQPADLITCVHGMHYLGDKLGFLQSAYAMLAPGGLFLGHLDIINVRAFENGLSVWRQAARHAGKSGASCGQERRCAGTQEPCAAGRTDGGVARLWRHLSGRDRLRAAQLHRHHRH